MAPALVAVGTYALLLAWNEYLYNFLLLSTPQSMTVAVVLGAVPLAVLVDAGFVREGSVGDVLIKML